MVFMTRGCPGWERIYLDLRMMIAVQNWLVNHSFNTKLIMQVHDELVLEVPDAEVEIVTANLSQLMENIGKFDVPLRVKIGIGKNWEQAH